jgi:putative nucleotidyltransferase with HDIG domain
MAGSEEDFTAIRVSTLRGDLQIPFDVYVKVGERYVHYCRAGTSFEGSRLDRLKTKQLKKMYIRPEDKPNYQQYLDASIDAAYSNNPVKPIEIRAEVIQGFEQAAAEDYMDHPKDEMTYQHVRSSAHRFVDFLDREPEGAGALLKLKNTDHSITHHCVNVAALSTAMVLSMKLKEGANLPLLSLGCLLHDIEHYYTGLDVAKPVEQLTPEEQQEFKDHPLKGAHRLQGAMFVDQLVINIITQHEEHSDGSGFPKKLTEIDVDPLVLVAATANAYDRLVSFENMTPKDALKSFMINKMGQFPLNYLQGLQEVLKKQKVIV